MVKKKMIGKSIGKISYDAVYDIMNRRFERDDGRTVVLSRREHQFLMLFREEPGNTWGKITEEIYKKKIGVRDLTKEERLILNRVQAIKSRVGKKTGISFRCRAGIGIILLDNIYWC